MKLKLVLAATMVSLASQSFSYTRIVAFGDSLSDQGNVFALSGTPAAPYWQGRYSNGETWIGDLAGRLGLPLSASNLGGKNFAYGGAELDTTNAFSHNGTPNIGTQIGLFASGGGTLSSNDLVSVWGGGNDFLNGATSPSTVAGYVTTHLNSLYALGGRNFIVPNLPPLGYTPANLGGPGETLANLACAAFNAALAANIAAFKTAHPGVVVHELNVHSLFTDVRNNPGMLGLTDVTHAYLATGGDPDHFLFWDTIHPTKQVHSYVGSKAALLVPEPTSLAVLGLGVLALARRRRA